VAKVSATASRLIHAIINTSPVSCCCAMAGTRPLASKAIAAKVGALAGAVACSLMNAILGWETQS